MLMIFNSFLKKKPQKNIFQHWYQYCIANKETEDKSVDIEQKLESKHSTFIA